MLAGFVRGVGFERGRKGGGDKERQTAWLLCVCVWISVGIGEGRCVVDIVLVGRSDVDLKC